MGKEIDGKEMGKERYFLWVERGRPSQEDFMTFFRGEGWFCCFLKLL